MPQKRPSEGRRRRWDRHDNDGILFLEILLHWDALTFIASLFVFIVSTPVVLVLVVSLAAAIGLCTLLIRFANRKESLSPLNIGRF